MKEVKDYMPQDLYKILSETVIGQEEYLKKLSNIVWLHNKRLEARESNDIPDRYLKKHNMLCVGPTGSGKTLAVTTLADIYGFDVAIFNAPDFTGSGWKGRDCHEMIQELYLLCDRDKKRTESAIIILDEIDKMILQNRTERDPSACAEHSMLKVIEGMNVMIEVNNRKININTKHILFIVAGAFEGIEESLKKRLGMEKRIGFYSEKEMHEEKDIYGLITREDLKKYGAGIQFLGRFSELAHLRELKAPELAEILINSKASIVNSMGMLLRSTANVNVRVDEKGAIAVAELAVREKTGARGLSQIVMEKLQDHLFALTDSYEMKEILFTANEMDELEIKTKSFEKSEEEKKEKVVQINCHSRKNSVECYVDYIMNANPELNKVNIREIRAAHALLCSIIHYLLLECNEDDQNTTSIKKLLKVSIPEREPDTVDTTVFEILKNEQRKEYRTYYDTFIFLDPSLKSVKLAEKCLDCFVADPKFVLKAAV